MQCVALCSATMELLLFLLLLLLLREQASAQPGFLSLACGTNQSFTDANGIQWLPDAPFLSTGGASSTAQQLFNDTIPQPLRTLRSFHGAGPKFCYTIPVNMSQRYLVRATFLYSNYDGLLTAPGFPLYLNVTHWADVQIAAMHKSVFEEMVFLSTGTLVHVCIVKGPVGTPFISTLELRRLIGSMYSVGYQLQAHLKHVVRINFGATTVDDVRYPDDEVDRIWQSDRLKPNNLAHEAPGTVRISTASRIGLSAVPERPPQKVLQSAVFGTNGSLTYRYLIPEFPANVFARSYFAEIQSLRPADVRAFTFVLPNDSHFRGQPVNLARDIGAFQGYAPGYENLSLSTIINFGFQQTPEANLGPILNAMEILQIVPKQTPTNSADVEAVREFMLEFGLAGEGDPCLPVAWDWVACNQTSPRITGLLLSNRDLSGVIPVSISALTALTEIELRNNSLTGSIPNLSPLSGLQIIHLEHNKLSGPIPDSLAGLGNLQELNLESNMLTGIIPPALLTRSSLNFQFSGNPGLCPAGKCSGHSGTGSSVVAVVGGILGGVLLCVAVVAVTYTVQARRRHNPGKPNVATTQDSSRVHIMSSHGPTVLDNTIVSAALVDHAHRFPYQELKQASNNFGTIIGSGGFGVVYYAKLADGREAALKVKNSQSKQGTKEFTNEVMLLSRIHHRNLVTFIGYCDENGERILVYELMHLGTLRDRINAKEHINWAMRLRYVLDAARGLDYLHTGCNPSIIHRDVKSNNILINKMDVAKVADFGLSTILRMEEASTTVKGSLGFLDPEYCVTQHLNEKSDVYSFGVVLLEVISGREPLGDHNIVLWARSALHKGGIDDMVDPRLVGTFSMDSLWKVAEVAMFCVEPHGSNRPTMSAIILEIQEAYAMECNAVEDQQAAGTSYHLQFAPRSSVTPVSPVLEPHAR